MSLSFYSKWFGLEGRAAVVIGGSGPVGGAVAEGLALAGATIVVAGRSESRGHGCVERIRSRGGDGGFRFVDLGLADAADQLLDFALGEHGQVDILVNAASTVWPAEWTTRTSEVFAAAMAGQRDGGAVLNLLPDHEAGRAAAAATCRLARKYAGSRVRLNVLRGPCQQAPEELQGAALLLLSPQAGARVSGCELVVDGALPHDPNPAGASR